VTLGDTVLWARGGVADKTHFMHFGTVFENDQLVPGGEDRTTKSLKDTTKNNIFRQKALSVTSSIPQSCKPSLSRKASSLI
jgi:hypothetical protein